MNIKEPEDLGTRLAAALPSEFGYEKGFRDAIELLALALGGDVSADAFNEAITVVLDAYSNNAPLEEEVTLNLNVFDDVGNVVDGTTATLSVSQLSDIVDHASQLVLIQRDGQSLANVLAELDEALSVASIIDARDAASAPAPSAEEDTSMAQAIALLQKTFTTAEPHLN